MNILAVVVAKKPVVAKGLKLKGYECADCGHQFATQSEIPEPFCPHCGSDSIESAKVPKLAQLGSAMEKATGEDIASIHCGGCNNQLISMTAGLELLLNKDTGKIFCPGCGADTVFTFEDEESEEASAKKTSEKASADTASNSGTEENGCNREPPVPCSVPVLIENCGPYSFAQVGSTVIALNKDHLPCAIATGQPAGMADTLNESCSVDGFKLAECFTAMRTEITVPALVGEAVDKAVANALTEQRKAYDDELSKLGERYSQALSIILTGMNRGMFPKNQMFYDVIRDALSAGNVPCEVASNVFTELANNSDDIALQLHELASTLVEKSDEVRNTMAETAAVLPVVHYEVASDSDNKQEHASVMTELTKPMRETASVQDTSRSTSAGQTRVAQLAAKSAFLS